MASLREHLGFVDSYQCFAWIVLERSGGLSVRPTNILSSTFETHFHHNGLHVTFCCRRNGSLTTSQCVRQIYQQHGIRGFYKGITASYFGVTETVIHFVIYEAIKARLREYKGTDIYEEQRSFFDFVEFMAAGATSKTIATCVAYPHGEYATCPCLLTSHGVLTTFGERTCGVQTSEAASGKLPHPKNQVSESVLSEF